MPRPWTRFVPALFVLALAAGHLVLVLPRTGGLCVYTLDDPYIHLALSESIAAGHYGLNLGEPSAPASSFLWPLLLAPFAGTALHVWVPLVLGLAATLGSAVLLRRMLLEVVGAQTRGAERFATAMACVLLFAWNLVGVVFTGLEHAAHVFVTLLVVRGLVAWARGGAPSRALLLGIALAPLLRYEGLALSGAASVLLFFGGHKRAGALALGIPLVLLAGFSLYLVSLGLAPLPSSVLVHGGFGGHAMEAGADPAVGPLAALLELLDDDGAKLVLGMSVLLLALAVRERGTRAAAVALVGAAGGVAHLALGRFGWLGRYEVYLVTALGLWILWLLRASVARAVEARGAAVVVSFLALLALATSQCLWRYTLRGPEAVRNIHEQSYQVRRLVLESGYDAVAVNDIGWVSFANDVHVVDLWGLASEEARELRARGEPGWVERVTAKHAPPLAAVFPTWFGEALPAAWVRVGTLAIAGEQRSVGRPRMALFATAAEHAPALAANLERFAPGLPPGVELEILRP